MKWLAVIFAVGMTADVARHLVSDRSFFRTFSTGLVAIVCWVAIAALW